MKPTNSLQTAIFSCILIGILAIYGLILYKVNEIENYLQINEDIKVTDEFKFMVDFADRNIEIFIWYSTLLFAIVAIFSGLVLNYQFGRKIRVIDEKLEFFTNEQTIRYNKINQSTSILSINVSMDTAYSLRVFSEIIVTENVPQSVYLKFKSLETYLKAVDMGMKTTSGFNMQLENIITEIKELIPKMKPRSGQPVIMQTEFKAMLKVIPEDLFKKLNEVIALYNAVLGDNTKTVY